MELFYVLLVVLVCARAFGALAVRVGQPELVGQLVSGIVIGVVAHSFDEQLPVLSGLHDDEVFAALTSLGVFFLMLLGGMEMHPGKFAKASRSSVFIALGGMLVPLGIGLGLGWLILPESSHRPAQALFLGVALAITAVPVAVKVLMDLGRLNTKVGQAVVSAAVIDDMLSLLLLAMLTALLRTGEFPGAIELLLLLGKIGVFLAVVFVAGRFIGPWVSSVLRRSTLHDLEMTALLVGAFALAVLAELLGMHFVLGAFAAGLFFGRRMVNQNAYRSVRRKVAAVTTAFLAPIFFVSIGLELDVSALWSIPGFVFGLIVVAFLGKLLGAGLVARFTGYDLRDSTAIGCLMSVRGAVELIIANIALEAGLFDQPDPPPPIIRHMFSAVVIMAIVTTLAPPVALRYLLGRRSS